MENDKKHKIFQFSKFLCFFVKVWKDFVDWNVLKINKVRFGRPVVFYEEINAMFSMKRSQIDIENDKTKSFQFSKFLCLFC